MQYYLSWLTEVHQDPRQRSFTALQSKFPFKLGMLWTESSCKAYTLSQRQLQGTQWIHRDYPLHPCNSLMGEVRDPILFWAQENIWKTDVMGITKCPFHKNKLMLLRESTPTNMQNTSTHKGDWPLAVPTPATLPFLLKMLLHYGPRDIKGRRDSLSFQPAQLLPKVKINKLKS